MTIRDFVTHKNLWEGKNGEIIVDSSTKTQFKAKEGYRIEHTDFKNYTYGFGVDSLIIKEDKIIGANEVKNLRDRQKHCYNAQWVYKHIISRFMNSGLLMKDCAKIATTTFLDLLTEDGIDLLRLYGIIPVEVGERLTSNFFMEKQKLYILGAKIKNAINSYWLNRKKVNPPKFSISSNQSLLVNYSHNANNIIVNNSVENYDTPTTDYNQIIAELIKEDIEMKAKETARLRKLYDG
jgi:hypothetical protein